MTLPSLEEVSCYHCGSDQRRSFLVAEDDLTGKPGRFPFVVCTECGFTYQFPRISVERIKEYYDDEYIAHRKKRNWGPFGSFVDRAMDRLDRKKVEIVGRYVELHADDEVLDVGCGAGTFLSKLRTTYRVNSVGVDFIDLAHLPGFEQIEFHCGLFYNVAAGEVEPVATSRRMIEALRLAGGQPRHTEYAGVGHNVFMWAYTEPALVEWLFARAR